VTMDVFEKLEIHERDQVKSCLILVYNCIQVASDAIQEAVGKPLLNS
jgi:hypothetical protein